MRRIKLHLDMADREWFEPNTTIVAEVDASDVAFFYSPFGAHIRAARMHYNGREFVLYAARADALPWAEGFGATVADTGGVSWSEAVNRSFVGVPLEAKGKAFVERES